MDVNIDEIENITIKLLKELRHRNGNVIHISEDMYWNIDSEEKYNLLKDPVPDVGSLTDNMQEIRDVKTTDSGELVLWHDIDALANVLLAICNEELKESR